MYKHSPLFKLKYMCRKCPGKEIWTTRDRVAVSYTVLDLSDYYEKVLGKCKELEKEDFYDGHAVCEKYTELDKKNKAKRMVQYEENSSNPEEKPYIQTLFGT